MNKKLNKIISLVLVFSFIFQQIGFAQLAPSRAEGVAAELNIASHLSALHSSLSVDKFRPLHLRYLSYDSLNNNFKLFLDKGDLKNPQTQELESTSKDLLNYFFIGLSLPNDAFWVNLRPDAEDNIIDDSLAQTDVGKIMLETDLQLKKDTARFTSPLTPEGKEYWTKLYQKADELFGSENITIPTLTRPWIVPDEIIIRETVNDGRGTPSAYIYKATLKVMLEQDYLKSPQSTVHSPQNELANYSFRDQRLKALNEYSTQLIRELIIPKLTKEVNTSKRYAPLRQVYYSLILAQWFKARHKGLSPQGTIPKFDSRDLTNLTSQQSWSKAAYFQAYQKSFKDGEYNIKEPAYTSTGQVIRSYMSGGISIDTASSALTTIPAVNNRFTVNPNLVSLSVNADSFSSLIGQNSAGSSPAISVTFDSDLSKPYNRPIEISTLPESASSPIGLKTKKFLKIAALITLLSFIDLVEIGAGPVSLPKVENGNMIKIENSINTSQNSDKNKAINSIEYFSKIIQRAKWGIEILSQQEWVRNVNLKDMPYHKGGAVTLPYTMKIYYGSLIPSAGHLAHETIHVLQSSLKDQSIIIDNYDELEILLEADREALNNLRQLRDIYISDKYNPAMVDSIKNSKDLSLEDQESALRFVAANETWSLLFGFLVDLTEQDKESPKYASCRLDQVMIANIIRGILNNPEAKELFSNYYVKLGLSPDMVKKLLLDHKVSSSPLEEKTASSAVAKEKTSSSPLQKYDLHSPEALRERLIIAEEKLIMEMIRKQEGFSIKDYFMLSEYGEKTLRELFRARLHATYNDFFISDEISYPLVLDDTMTELVSLVQYFLSLINPTDRIVALGRSPLWFIEAIRLYENRNEPVNWLFNGKSERYVNAAFSGGKEDNVLSEDKIIAYRNYLRKIGLDPKTIIDKFIRFNSKTIIVEFIESGKSLDVFLKILIDWANQDLSESSKDEFRKALVLGKLIPPPGFRDKGFYYKHQFDQLKSLELSIGPSLTNALSGAESFLCNIGVKYEPELWGTNIDPRISPISERANLVRFRIIDFYVINGILRREAPRVLSQSSSASSAVAQEPVGSSAVDRQEGDIGVQNANVEDVKVISRMSKYIPRVAKRLSEEEALGLIQEAEGGTRGRVVVKVYRQTGAVIGYVFAQDISRIIIDAASGKTLHISHVAIGEGFRNSGYGKELIQAIINDARVNGYKEVSIWPSEGNEAMKSVVKSLGFKNDGRMYRFSINIESPSQNTEDNRETGGIDGSTSSPLIPQDPSLRPSTNSGLRSGSTPLEDRKGGIDFRALPIVTQAMSNLRLSASSAISLNQLNSISLNQELQEIQKMIEAGIIPSTDRIKEYVQASCLKGDSDMQKVISCIADILRLEEENCCSTETTLKDILVVLESGRPTQELKAIFVGS